MDKAIRIALVGQNKKWRTGFARYLKSAHKFKYLTLDAYMVSVLSNLYHKSNLHTIKWETRVRFYNAWHKIDPDIWINKVARHIILSEPETNIVVPDVRYMNEVEVLKDLGFTFVRITSNPSQSQYIKSLQLDANPGSILYYEHFAPNTIYCKYAFHVTSYHTGKVAADKLVELLSSKNLT